jgi:hypothetical protein
MSAMTTDGHNRLAHLRAEIIARENEIRGHAKAGVQAAMDAGDYLTEVKALIGHGAFIPWVSRETGVSPRTARRFMALAANRALIEANWPRVASLSVRQACREVVGLGQRRVRTDLAQNWARSRLLPPQGHGRHGVAAVGEVFCLPSQLHGFFHVGYIAEEAVFSDRPLRGEALQLFERFAKIETLSFDFADFTCEALLRSPISNLWALRP